MAFDTLTDSKIRAVVGHQHKNKCIHLKSLYFFCEIGRSRKTYHGGKGTGFGFTLFFLITISIAGWMLYIIMFLNGYRLLRLGRHAGAGGRVPADPAVAFEIPFNRKATTGKCESICCDC